MSDPHSNPQPTKLPADLAEIQASSDQIAKWMDEAIVIPGLGIKLGWDSILGVVPVVGDSATLASHLFLLFQAIKLGVPLRVYFKMLCNAGIDFFIGLVPIVGDILDVFWRANRRNADLLRAEIARRVNTMVDQP